MLIREVADDELDDLADLLVRAYQEHLDVFPDAVATAYRAELVDVHPRRATSDILVVAERPGRLVGSATLVRDALDDGHPWPPGGAVLRLVAVDPAARRRGIATALTRECVDRAKRLSAAYLGLHTAPAMTAARRLYERLGFRRAPEHDFDPDLYYGGGGHGAAPWGLAYVLRLEDGTGPS